MEKKYSVSELRALANELQEKSLVEGHDSLHELQQAMQLRTALQNVASYLERMQQEAMAQLEKDLDQIFKP